VRSATALLRGLAIAIAIAGLVDPAITMSGSVRPKLAVVMAQPSPEADRVRARLTGDLKSSFEIRPAMASDVDAAIMVGSRYVDEPVSEKLPVATVTMAGEPSSVRIVRVDTPADVPAATAIHVIVDLEGRDVAGRTSVIVVRIGGLEVGRTSHRWDDVRLKPDTTNDVRLKKESDDVRPKPDTTAVAPVQRWRTALDVVPVGAAPYVLRIEAVTGEATAVADRLVDLRRELLRVQFYESRPSWAATFVRRALESDARFQVAGISYSSRGIAARTQGDVPLADPRLNAVDVVIVGGLDKLSVGDVRSLDRFMRERGGAVVLLPDERIAGGPAADLLPGEATEHLLEQPAKLAVESPAASIAASELLLIHARVPDATVVASLPGRDAEPVIVSVPHGDGRLLVSGAMDAWRFRSADQQAFDRFWQSAISGLALSARQPVSVSVDPSVIIPGGEARVTVHVRSSSDGPVSATFGDQPIRLVPSAERGVFHATVVAGPDPSRVPLRVEVGGANPHTASRSIVVRQDARPSGSAASVPLALMSSSHHGVDATPERLADVERFIRSVVAAPAVPVEHRPMRSPWWLVPFIGCLCAEWWVRRRRGLR
jgi:hypothetical protein